MCQIFLPFIVVSQGLYKLPMLLFDIGLKRVYLLQIHNFWVFLLLHKLSLWVLVILIQILNYCFKIGLFVFHSQLNRVNLLANLVKFLKHLHKYLFKLLEKIGYAFCYIFKLFRCQNLKNSGFWIVINLLFHHVF